MENAAAGLMSMLFSGYGEICKAFYQKFGREALPVISQVMGQGGMNLGKAMQQSYPVRTLKAIGQRDIASGSMLGWEMEVVELTDKVSHFKMSKCPLGLQGTSRELCEAMMASDQEKANTFTGQKVDMKILKTVAAGDDKCEIIFSMK